MSTVNKNPDNVATVDVTRHRTLRVKPNPGYAHAQEQHVAGIILSELAVCAASFPVVFVQRPDDGKFLLVAMLGLRAGENVYYGPDSWESTYVPLAIQRHPFLIGYDDRVPDGSQITTCVATNSPFLSEQEGQPLFTEAGAESDFLKSTHQLLSALFEGQKITDRFTQALVDLGLIVPIDLLLQQQNAAGRKASGLFTLDELKLKNLGVDQLRELHQQDFLPPCYIILASLHQLGPLIRLRNRKGQDQIVNFQIDFKTGRNADAQ